MTPICAPSTQAVRVLDVLAIGPVMVYAAMRRELPGWLRLALGAFGATTIGYNAVRFVGCTKSR